ncbi:MAG: ATP-dependent zinc metalloprotease FtsH, partial [Actinomycetota bacterium]|nr:ATP-dependent zinc metalloprotease FtsH [Actinomycetota bacterium]
AGAPSPVHGLARVPHVVEPRVPDVTFADVAGLDEVVEELREIRDYLLDPGRFRAVGATLPKGFLLVGPPGTGKTLLTKALAGEAGIPFQVVSSASLVEVYVGVGAARVRSIFAQARKKAPSIVLLDELDAIGRSRSLYAGAGQEERESTLNQLLTEMDGFEPATGVLVVGATNRPDVLDPALLRPGRFDRRLVVSPPDLPGRRAILKVHARCKPLDPGADLDAIARRTAGFTGADLANVMNEAALLTGRRHRSRVGAEELEEAIERLMTGPRRPTRAISARDKQVIAYHESGHVLVGWILAHGQDVHRVSVVARGRSHGYTLSVPTEDRLLVSRSELLTQLAVLMGGRVAEELVFADPTTGAEDDLARASALAQRMVGGYGMSERVGLLSYASNEDAPPEPIRTPVATEVTAEVRRLLREAYDRACASLSEHRAELDRLADRLVTMESLDKAEIEQLLADVPRQAAASMRPGPGAPPPRRQRRSAA